MVDIFPNCAMAPTGLEVTMVARNVDGVSEIRTLFGHVSHLVRWSN